jgi:uncharacterized protein
MQFPHARILIFAKAPVPGLAKTRLIPALGATGAAEVQAELLRRTLAEASGAALAPVTCWCAPDPSHPLFGQLAEAFSIELRGQSGADLGERMHQALAETLAETLATSPAAILLGCDIPTLQARHLRAALEALEQGLDAVLGPAEDGGYWLIGLRRPAAALFEGIPWGSDQVLTITRQRLRGLGWRWQELETLWDLDRPADLERWRRPGGGLDRQTDGPQMNANKRKELSRPTTLVEPAK